MLVKIWRQVTVMFIGLSMGTVLCHLLEMPAKMTYDGSLWLTLLHTLYPPAVGTVGAFFEVGAVVTSVTLGSPAPISVRLDAFGGALKE